MKQIINGRKYDTETANKLGDWNNGCFYGDFNHCSETLYQKKNGEYFLLVDAGPLTKYAVKAGNNISGVYKIMTMTEKEALNWASEHLDGDTVEDIFGEIPE